MTKESKHIPGFADRLITVLTQAGMRPEDLAARIEVPREVLQACLKSKVPEPEVLCRMAEGLDTTMEWLLTDEAVKLPNAMIQ